MSWLDKAFVGVLTVASNGVAQPQEPTLNFGAGFSVADSPTTGSTTVTNTGASNVPLACQVITASTAIASPSVNTSYAVQSSTPITITITGTPVDGVELTFYDETQNWVTYNFTFTSQSGWTVRNPWSIATSDTQSVVFGAGADAVNGQSFTLKCRAPVQKWIS